MVSSYEYSDTVIPLAEFTGTHTAYSVGNNQFMLYEGNEIPKKYLPEFHAGGGAGRPQQRQLCGVYFNGTNGNGKYRIDIYNMNGTQVLSLPFAIEYRDVLISDQELIIYNEAECLIYNLNGKRKIQRTDTGTDAAFKNAGRKPVSCGYCKQHRYDRNEINGRKNERTAGLRDLICPLAGICRNEKKEWWMKSGCCCLWSFLCSSFRWLSFYIAV